jgi:ADP-ribose pyrophosphatase YjhB (NUDIX family)
VIPRWLGAAPYRLFGQLPQRVRRRVARALNPLFTLGASVVLVEDGRLLLVRHSYRRDWSTPGGFLRKGEQPADAAVREVREELGLDVEVLTDGVWVVHARPHVDVTFRARRTDPAQSAASQGPEIEAVEWFGLDQLPPLDPECARVLRSAGVIT